jgi:hypothetical protein
MNVRRAEGFAVGDKITVGTPASQEIVTVTAVGSQSPDGAALDFTPALSKSHVPNEWVVAPGTGLDLAAPLQFSHAANLPFSDRGTGISFHPAAAFDHSSNEPVQALGTGITLDRSLTGNHPIHEVVREERVKTAGYQGTPIPNQWFGGPELTTDSPIFGRIITIEEGSMVLRDATGVVADSLNYGSLADPWAAEGYQAAAGARQSGCYAPAPGSVLELWSTVAGPVPTNTSAGRFPDGADTGSNCADFLAQAAATLLTNSPVGATNIKVSSVEGFSAGQKIMVDSGANLENATIATVGTAGATKARMAMSAGTAALRVENVTGFTEGQTITIDSGVNSETVVVHSVRERAATITLVAPLARAHAAGVQISGSGISLAAALTRAHAVAAPVSNDVPTPGAPNRYHKGNH